MRNLHLGALAIAALLVACGGSSGEVKAARSAHYKGDKVAIFNAAKAAVQAKYPIEKSDENALIFSTIGRWYTHEGLTASERMEDIRDVPDLSIHIAFVVAVRPDGDAYVVDIKPKWYRFHAGTPAPEPLSEDDMSVEGFAHGKLEALAVDIHDALKPYEVQSVPAQVPAGPGATPAAGPAAPAAPAAPAGSAAPAPAPQ
ncbi:MAG: hypothetical protein ACM31C_34105 [Acidobacteriota bacterium]